MARKGMDVQAFNENTARIMAYAKKHGLEVEPLNDGLQLRLRNGKRYVDVWPSTAKYMPNGGQVGYLPHDDTKFHNVFKTDLNIGKRRKKKPQFDDPEWVARERFVRADGTYTLRELFKDGYVIQLVRKTNKWGKVTWHIYEQVSKYSQTGWQLHTAQQVEFAKQLADQYHVEKKEWRDWK